MLQFRRLFFGNSCSGNDFSIWVKISWCLSVYKWHENFTKRPVNHIWHVIHQKCMRNHPSMSCRSFLTLLNDLWFWMWLIPRPMTSNMVPYWLSLHKGAPVYQASNAKEKVILQVTRKFPNLFFYTSLYSFISYQHIT